MHLAFFIPQKGGTFIDFLWEQITDWLEAVLAFLMTLEPIPRVFFDVLIGFNQLYGAFVNERFVGRAHEPADHVGHNGYVRPMVIVWI